MQIRLPHFEGGWERDATVTEPLERLERNRPLSWRGRCAGFVLRRCRLKHHLHRFSLLGPTQQAVDWLPGGDAWLYRGNGCHGGTPYAYLPCGSLTWQPNSSWRSTDSTGKFTLASRGGCQ